MCYEEHSSAAVRVGRSNPVSRTWERRQNAYDRVTYTADLCQGKGKQSRPTEADALLEGVVEHVVDDLQPADGAHSM